MAWVPAGLVLGLAAFLLGPASLSAQQPPPGGLHTEPPPPITVTTDSPFPLRVNGLPASALTTTVKPLTEACVQDPLRYVSQRERWAFLGWSHGPKAQCVTLTDPGVYRALYDHEFVIHIRSDVGRIRESRWAVAGSRVEVKVPETVEEGKGARFRFLEWGEGESPFTARNVVAPLAPMDLEPKWVKEYLVQIEGPENVGLEGSGWYEQGSPLVLRAPEVIKGGVEGERLKFASWQSVGIPVRSIPEAGKASTEVAVDGPYKVRATYAKEYLVVAQSPFGVLIRQWVQEGEPVVLEAPAIQETVPGQLRFVFQRWSGQEGLTSPKITGVANQPITISAVYERQYLVVVEAPFGASGGGWHTAGTGITVSVPQEVESKVIFKKSFKGFTGFPRGQSSIDFPVDKPTVITALYSTGVNAGILSLLLLIPLAAVILFFANRWVTYLVRRRRKLGTRTGGKRRLFGRL